MLTLPFTTEQFFEVLGRYNIAVWPAQVALFALALVIVPSANAQRHAIGEEHYGLAPRHLAQALDH